MNTCIYSVEEAGRYLETYKVYENKPAEALMERIDTDYVSKVGPDELGFAHSSIKTCELNNFCVLTTTESRAKIWCQ